MTGLYIVLAVLGIIGFAVGLTAYALRQIDKGKPGWVAQDEEEPLGPGPCPQGPRGMKGPSGEMGE